jgi:hypothetical protein
MQDDDTANPGMLFVQLGGQLWNRAVGAADKSCADCHGDAAVSMKGVAARYPAIPQGSDRPVDLEGRINLCRTEHQMAEPLPPENRDLLALAVYVAHQSRDLQIAPPYDPHLDAFRREGAEIYRRRHADVVCIAQIEQPFLYVRPHVDLPHRKYSLRPILIQADTRRCEVQRAMPLPGRLASAHASGKSLPSPCGQLRS